MFLKNEYLESIKDKKIKILYEIVSNHLNYVRKLDTVDSLNIYIKDILSFINGYTPKDKKFKQLRKYFLYAPLNLDFLYQYAKIKIEYLENPKLRRLDDLMIYFEKQSLFGMLLFITDPKAQIHLEPILLLSKIDKIYETLLHLNELKQTNQIHLPIQLIEDYGLEIVLDKNVYLMNDRFFGVWNLFYIKLNQLLESLKPKMILFDDLHQELIFNYLSIRKDDLNHFQKTLKK
ncbi:MAG TPA: hypothetical protein GYA04_02655 [Acholeplasma sp.]|nr:hypothetical protein [Acholeplasma sp.]